MRITKYDKFNSHLNMIIMSPCSGGNFSLYGNVNLDPKYSILRSDYLFSYNWETKLRLIKICRQNSHLNAKTKIRFSSTFNFSIIKKLFTQLIRNCKWELNLCHLVHQGILLASYSTTVLAITQNHSSKFIHITNMQNIYKNLYYSITISHATTRFVGLRENDTPSEDST